MNVNNDNSRRLLIFKNYEEPYSSQKKVLGEWTKLFETIQ